MSEGKKLKILFMGTPEFAVASLRRLVDEGYNIVGVVTVPDKPAGRGRQLQQSAVKRYASETGLHVLQPEKLRDPAFLEDVRSLAPDLGIVIAFRMLPEALWSLPRMGTVNLHASLLPQYRGAAPINWAIINGEQVTGVTTFMLNSEIDMGDILGKREVGISREDNAGSLHDKLMETGSGLVLETVEAIASGTAFPIAQPENDKTLKPAPKIFREDCLIRWNRSPREIYDFVRGLSPYPAAWRYLIRQAGVMEGKKTEQDDCRHDTVPNDEPSTAKIYSVHPEDSSHSDIYGKIVSDGRSYIRVACAGGWVYIRELQLAGKKRMDVEEFLHGFKDMDHYSF